MLRVLREHATSWMLRGILILVAVTFISWGGYSLIREETRDYAAKVNGEKIGYKEYVSAYQAMAKQYRDALGPAFSEKLAEELRLKDKVLDDLISRKLILQEAKRLGMSVRDEELRQILESVPAFHVDGRFDPRIYDRFLRLNRMTSDEFEQGERERLLLSKMVNLIRLNGGKVSEEEVMDSYVFSNERINVNFVKISPDAFKAETSANDIEIKDYYEKHQEDFRIPAFIQIQYLHFRSSDYETNARVSAEEVQRAYDLQKESFRTPKRVKVREVLIKSAPQDSAEKVEASRKRAEEVLVKAKQVKDFSSLAKQYSEGPSASKGGETGWIQKGTLDEPSEAAVFALKQGEISPVVRRPSGFSIFKADQVQEEKERSLDEVRDQIVQRLKRERAASQASREADDAFYSVFRDRDLEKFAKEKNVPIKTTGFFKAGDDLPEIGRDPSFYSSALSLKVGEISPVVSAPPNFYVLKLVNKKDSRIPAIAEVKEEIRRNVIAVKSEEKAKKVSEELLAQIRKGKPIREAARERGFSTDETGLFARTSGLIPKIGPVGRESLTSISSLTEKNPVSKEPLRTKDGYFVLVLQNSQPPDVGPFSSLKKDLEKRLTYQKQDEFFQNWLVQLRAKAKVEVTQETKKAS